MIRLAPDAPSAGETVRHPRLAAGQDGGAAARAGETLPLADAACLLAIHLEQRIRRHRDAHLQIARRRLLDAAKSGAFAIVAGSWFGPAMTWFPLPPDCVQGLDAESIDWESSAFDASSGVPVAATPTVQGLHAGSAKLAVPLTGFIDAFGIDDQTIRRWRGG